ncbi:hypothetical protein ACVOMT_22310 [Sphingomonas panni]
MIVSNQDALLPPGDPARTAERHRLPEAEPREFEPTLAIVPRRPAGIETLTLAIPLAHIVAVIDPPLKVSVRVYGVPAGRGAVLLMPAIASVIALTALRSRSTGITARRSRPVRRWGPRVRCRGACQAKTIDDGAVIELRRGFEPVCKLLMPVGQIGQDVPDAVEGSEFVVLRLVASYQHIGGCSKVGHRRAGPRVLAKERGKLDILRIEISPR